ncbi:MAG: hypothetical protein AAGE84_24370 [Cyanobacteria bacterium P01_G01_bin.39]
MESKKLEFIQLIDHALKIAEQDKSQNQVEQLNNLTGVLQTIKSQALADQLEPSQGSLTLGLSRGVADWVDSLDSPLLKAVGAIEQYYQKHL